jgi:hypothetical protein
MNNLVTPISYGAFMISTTIFMRRAGYSWVAAALTGFFSPLAFIILFAVVLLPVSFLVGKLGISEQRLQLRGVLAASSSHAVQTRSNRRTHPNEHV